MCLCIVALCAFMLLICFLLFYYASALEFGNAMCFILLPFFFPLNERKKDIAILKKPGDTR